MNSINISPTEKEIFIEFLQISFDKLFANGATICLFYKHLTISKPNIYMGYRDLKSR